MAAKIRAPQVADVRAVTLALEFYMTDVANSF
ncbi:hypothetical protein FBZ87_101381 [Nitrospirillum amazonense]|uniref:Uncharacterized protein n=1 Tax=Nitrospirillum amazonense TaxID=28077 RepID=A0A560KHJ7_9PROT|nr:hypothetical protein FBZ87_101381 [Nitrospirillum amazonense]